MTGRISLERRPNARLSRESLLLVPAAVLFLLILAIPLGLMMATAFNPSEVGRATLDAEFTFENFQRLFSVGLYPDTLANSVSIGAVTAVIALVLAYPVAYVMANTYDVKRLTILTILLLIPFQVDITVRVFGLVVLLGDNGLINSVLQSVGFSTEPVPLMYNRFGVLIGTTQFMVPFVVFALVGALKGIEPDLIKAGRSLGMTYWRAFARIVLPLSLPAIAAGALVAFALTVSNFTIPVLMSSYRVNVLPALMYEQVTVVANMRFAAAMAVLLLAVSLLTVGVGYWAIRRVLIPGARR